MTLKELIEYEQLSAEDKYLYKHVWSKNSHWNHRQIMVYVEIDKICW